MKASFPPYSLLQCSHISVAIIKIEHLSGKRCKARENTHNTALKEILKWFSPQPFSTALQFIHQAGHDALESHSVCN